MRWKNPLSSGLKRSIEALPDRMMQGFGVGMEMSRMRAAREQAERARADEAARYSQATARRAQERQEDIDWRTGQAKTAAGQWAAEQAFRKQMFDAEQADRERQRQAQEHATALAQQYAPQKEAREVEKHAAELALKRAQAAASRANAQAAVARAENIRKVEEKQAELTKQFAALSADADRAAKMYQAIAETGSEEQVFAAWQTYEDARKKLEEASSQLGILDNYYRRLSAEELSDLEAIRTAPLGLE